MDSLRQDKEECVVLLRLMIFPFFLSQNGEYV